ncbi:MAG: hypothetical protein OEV94_07365 [Deltaproteobacteria bacterium]|nr:hypothetical protein [Deltaproteobacteria bacterium]
MARLTGPEKAAILMLTMGEDGAAEVMKNLSEGEIRQVTALMADYQRFTPADVTRVTNEFYLRKEHKPPPAAPPETRLRFLTQTLGRALGEEKSGELLGKIIAPEKGGALEKLKWYPPATIAQVLSKEHPQVIAVVLACFDDPELGAKVIGRLPPPLRQPVMERLAGIKGVPEEWLDMLESALGDLFVEPQNPEAPPTDGVKQISQVVAVVPPPVGQAMLAGLERKDPELASSIRRNIVTVDDLLLLDGPGIQKILDLASMEDVLLTLRAVGEDLREHILKNCSVVTARRLQTELASLAPARVRDMDAARQRLTQIAQRLAEAGEIRFLGKSLPAR